MQRLPRRLKDDRSAAFATWFTATSSTVTKTLAVAAAALLIAWLTGIEALHRDLSATLTALKKNNRQRQVLERVERTEYTRAVLASIVDLEQRRAKTLETLIPQLRSSQAAAAQQSQERRVKTIAEQIENVEKEVATARQHAKVVEEEQKRAEAAKSQRDALRAQFAKIQESSLAEWRQLASKRSTIAIEIFGLKLAFPPTYAAVAWAALLIALFVYAADRRRLLLGTTIDALRFSLPGSVQRSLRSTAPAWLAPVPRSVVRLRPGHEAVAPEAIADAYGWMGQGSWPGILTVAAATILIAVELRLLSIGLTVASELGSSNERAVTTAASISLALLTIASFLHAISAMTVPRTRRGIIGVVGFIVLAAAVMAALFARDPHAGNMVVRACVSRAGVAIASVLVVLPLAAFGVAALRVPMQHAIGVTRRRFLITAVAGVAGIFAAALLPARRDTPSKPQRVRHRRAVFGGNVTGFVKKRRKTVVHYLAGGLAWVRITRRHVRWLSLPLPSNASSAVLFSVGRYDPTVDAQLIKPLRVHLQRASASLEAAALRELAGPRRGQRVDRACRLLVYAINHDIRLKWRIRRLPSFRLYDLLAGLSIRYRCPKHLAELLRLINAFGMSSAFEARLARWNDPGSRWHTRWRDGSRKVRWNGHVLL